VDRARLVRILAGVLGQRLKLFCVGLAIDAAAALLWTRKPDYVFHLQAILTTRL
jgi:hypothetical protein